jgi:hypothetical protein
MVVTCREVAEVCESLDCELLIALCGHADALAAVAKNYKCDNKLLAGLCKEGLSRSTGGPGTELSKLLKRLGIEPTPTCACRAKAAEMDQWGCDECERPERIEEVVAVMRAEAEARGLPFLDIAGRLLIKRAISNARRNA